MLNDPLCEFPQTPAKTMCAYLAKRPLMLIALFVSLVFMQSKGQNATDQQRGKFLFHSCQAVLRLLDYSAKNYSLTQDNSSGQYCFGYIDGYTAFLINTKPTNVCIEGVNRISLIRQYTLFMKAHPQAMSAPKDWGLLQMLLDTYPCHSSLQPR